MNLLELIQIVGPLAAIVLFFIYNEVRNRSREIEAASRQSEADSEMKKTLATLTLQQQAQSERDSDRVAELSRRIDQQNEENITLRERVSAAESAQRILEVTMVDDRERWHAKETAAEKERTDQRAKLDALELRLEQQQKTINKLELRNENKDSEIAILRETHAALRKERDTLHSINARLGVEVQTLQERLKALERDTEHIANEKIQQQEQLIELQQNLTDCQNQAKTTTEDIDKPNTEKDVA